MYDYPTLTIFGSYCIFFRAPGYVTLTACTTLGQASTGRCFQSYHFIGFCDSSDSSDDNFCERENKLISPQKCSAG